MGSKKGEVWQEVETNRMWREISSCDNADELSNRAWEHLKKIAENICATDFRQKKSTLSALLNALFYKDANDLKDKSIAEDELKSIMEFLKVIVEKHDGIFDKFVKDNKRKNGTEKYEDTMFNGKSYEDRESLARQFDRLLKKYGLENVKINDSAIANVYELYRYYYELNFENHIQYGEAPLSITEIYNLYKSRPEYMQKIREYFASKRDENPK